MLRLAAKNRAFRATVISTEAESTDAARCHHGAALLIYIWASILLFGLGVLAHPQSRYVGRGADPGQFMWYLVWWPWAILHGHNPIYTRAVWFPTGYNLAWATSIAFPSLAVAPITLAFGPVVSYNVLTLLAPAITAWAGYLLCHRLTSSWWPSLAGGYVLGFSAYEVGHMAGQLHLTLFFIPPLLVLLALLFLDGTLGVLGFMVLFTSALVVQFTISTEVFATTTVCSAIVLLLAMMLRTEHRQRITLLSGLIGGSYGACAIMLSPVLYYVLAFGVPHEPIFPPARFSADLLGPLIPGPLMLFAPSSVIAISRRFVGGPWENGTYIGLPLLAVTVVFCISTWRQVAGKLILSFLAIVLVLSIGPVLHVAGWPSIPMPWATASRLPLLNNVLPMRLMSFAFVAVAVAFALWLASVSSGRKMKLLAALVCLMSIQPRPLHDLTAKVDTPAFFAQGLYAQYLARDANVLVIPYGRNGNSMLWQAQSDMYFKMAGGYLNLIPPDFRRWPIINTFYTSIPVPDDGLQLKAFLAAQHVDAIVLADPDPVWLKLFASLGAEPRAVGGVDIYDLRDLAPAALAASRAADLEAKADAAWFPELLLAAGNYLTGGRAIAELSPTALSRLGFVPSARWIDDLEVARAGWPVGLSDGLWIGRGRDGTVEVGLFGSHSAVQPLISCYGPDALAIYYPYPQKFSERATDRDEAAHFLLMSFRPEWVRHVPIAKSHQSVNGNCDPVSTERRTGARSARFQYQRTRHVP